MESVKMDLGHFCMKVTFFAMSLKWQMWLGRKKGKRNCMTEILSETRFPKEYLNFPLYFACVNTVSARFSSPFSSFFPLEKNSHFAVASFMNVATRKFILYSIYSAYYLSSVCLSFHFGKCEVNHIKIQGQV